MAHLMSVIIAWLALHTGLPATEELPQVKLSPPAAIVELRLGTNGLRSPLAAVAVYVDATRTIHLPETWDSRNVGDVSVLVHELVHHLQNVASARYACPGEREKAAYEAQARWLALFDRTLEQELGLDAMTLKVATGCMHP